jgi:hypothetical protein
MIPRDRGVRQHLPKNRYASRPTSIPVPIRWGETAEIAGGKLRLRLHGRWHFHCYPGTAIPIEMNALRQAQELGVAVVKVTDSRTGRVYEAPLATVWQEGQHWGEDADARLLLPLQRWQQIERRPHTPQFPTTKNRLPESKQAQPKRLANGENSHDN